MLYPIDRCHDMLLSCHVNILLQFLTKIAGAFDCKQYLDKLKVYTLTTLKTKFACIYEVNRLKAHTNMIQYTSHSGCYLVLLIGR